jgi:hypothetical protein
MHFIDRGHNSRYGTHDELRYIDQLGMYDPYNKKIALLELYIKGITQREKWDNIDAETVKNHVAKKLIELRKKLRMQE